MIQINMKAKMATGTTMRNLGFAHSGLPCRPKRKKNREREKDDETSWRVSERTKEGKRAGARPPGWASRKGRGRAHLPLLSLFPPSATICRQGSVVVAGVIRRVGSSLRPLIHGVRSLSGSRALRVRAQKDTKGTAAAVVLARARVPLPHPRTRRLTL